MASSVSLSIPHELVASHKNNNLQSQVEQLVLQKGPFRNVTERSLLADIEKSPAGNDEHAGTDGDNNTDTVEATRDKLFRVRADYLQMISFIQNNLLTAIDGISSSLAAHSKYAATAMSPFLQQLAPAGSIETKLTEPKVASRLATRGLKDIAHATRAQAFTSAVTKLASVSTRLDTEAQHQSKYWEQLASLRSKGWPVSRVPNDTKALVVHFGSAESAPQYRDKGMAALRQDENGDLVLPSQIAAEKPRFLSVTVHRRGKTTGRSTLGEAKPATSSSLEVGLSQAQEALFQEELFSEASREARLLASMGFKTRSSSVEVLVSDECSVSITYSKHTTARLQETHEDDQLAEFVLCALRMMLVAEHQQRHLQRADHKPPPMSQKMQVVPEYALLRPVVSLLRHQHELVPLLQATESYQKALNLAGLDFFVEHRPSEDLKSSHGSLQALRRIVTSRLAIRLPSKETITLKVETHLAAPYFGTRFSSLQYNSQCGSSMCTETSSYEDAVRFVEDVLCRDISTLILRQEELASWQLNREYPVELVLVIGNTRLAIMAATCSQGRVTITFEGLRDSFKESAQWDVEGFRMAGRKEQEQRQAQRLLEVVTSWTSKLEM